MTWLQLIIGTFLVHFIIVCDVGARRFQQKQASQDLNSATPKLCVWTYSGSNIRSRQFIRSQAASYVHKHIFILDQKEKSKPKENDIVRVPDTVTFQTLYKKARRALEYYREDENGKDCDWFMQINDDVMVNWHLLMDMLRYKQNIQVPILGGHFFYFDPQARRDGEKFSEGEAMQFATYPNGPMYVMNRVLFDKLKDFESSIIYKQDHVEDASLGVFFKYDFKSSAVYFWDWNGSMFGKYLPHFSENQYRYLALHDVPLLSSQKPHKFHHSFASSCGSWFRLDPTAERPIRMNITETSSLLGPQFEPFETLNIEPRIASESEILSILAKHQGIFRPTGIDPWKIREDFVRYFYFPAGPWYHAIRLLSSTRGLLVVIGTESLHLQSFYEFARRFSIRTVFLSGLKSCEDTTRPPLITNSDKTIFLDSYNCSLYPTENLSKAFSDFGAQSLSSIVVAVSSKDARTLKRFNGMAVRNFQAGRGVPSLFIVGGGRVDLAPGVKRLTKLFGPHSDYPFKRSMMITHIPLPELHTGPEFELKD